MSFLTVREGLKPHTDNPSIRVELYHMGVNFASMLIESDLFLAKVFL